MIVIGADPHKRQHTFAAVDVVSGELRSSETVASSSAGHAIVLGWGRGLGPQRVWAIEDCRHVSGRLERFLVAHGERVVRVAPKLMAGQRRSARERGKSDAIDAAAVARAVLREGIESLPVATADPQADEIRVLIDHRDDLVAHRTEDQCRLRWLLHDMFGEFEIPTGALDREKWLGKVDRRLARAEQRAQVRVARAKLRQIRQHTRQIRELERELALLVAAKAPQLLAEPGCGPLTAARIIADVGDITRFSNDAKLARLAGIAPIPASSGRNDRFRLDRGGNRRLNCAFHRLAITKGRIDPTTAAYLARKQAEGKNRMEALRCLKRHLARRVYQLLSQPTPDRDAPDAAFALT